MLKAYFCNAIFSYICSNFTQNMKIFTNVLLVIALALVIFNITLLDFSNLFGEKSIVALIGVVASFCAVCILAIFKISKMIAEKSKGRS